MWSKKAKGLTLALCMGVLSLALLLFGAYFLLTNSTMPQDGSITVTMEADGTASVSWPDGPGAEGYLFTLLQNGEPVYTQQTGTSCCTLPFLQEVTQTFQIQATRSFLGKTYPGRQALSVTARLTLPRTAGIDWSVDPDKDVLTLTARTSGTTGSRVRLTMGEETRELAMTDGRLVLDFGKEYPLPAEQPYTLTVTPYSENGQLTCVGVQSGEISVPRKEFFARELTAQCQETEKGLSFSWNEAYADHYELQQSSQGGEWETVQTVKGLGCTVETPSIFQSHAFRVAAVNEGEENYTSDQMELAAQFQAKSCTVWPLKNLGIYQNPDLSGAVGTAPAAQACWVLEQQGESLKVRCGDVQGWLDGRYCLINLPEYLGDLVSYHITNSYASVFKVHEVPIAGVTDKVVSGFEAVKQADGSFLVPLLYPTAQKLALAAKAAQTQGYRLKIYEAYRPRQATLAIYDLTQLVLNQQAGDTGLTYKQLMTDKGRYALGNFLAQGISNHNRGIALDMTLESMDRTELEMQTAIHDLSWYSEPAANNETANILRDIMLAQGFAPLKSEWWHFQDEQTKEALGLQPMMSGVSAQCWVETDAGWVFRNPDGTY